MKAVLALLMVGALLFGCASEPVRTGDRQKAAELNAELGLRYMLQQRYELSLEKLERSLEFQRDYAPAHHYLGELYRRLGETDDADAHYQLAVQYAPRDPNIRNNYGAFLCSEGRYNEGEAQFKVVLENPVFPQRAMTMENVGICLVEKEPARAEHYFRRALELNPRLPKSLQAMAEISLAAGNPLSARAYLQRYQELLPHSAETLWVGIQAEQALGARSTALAYGRQLKQDFPDSPQAREWQRLERTY